MKVQLALLTGGLALLAAFFGVGPFWP